MKSHTPKFDSAIRGILSKLVPHTVACSQCEAEFAIELADINFYKRFEVPSPTLCPSCRLQRKFGYRINFVPVFHKKTCSTPGHSEKVIALYSEANPVKVYDDDFYYSDAWDASSFGIEPECGKPFFEQWQKWVVRIPRQTLQKDRMSVDCDYVVSGVPSNKNCYYVAVPYQSENVFYSTLPGYSKNCLDMLDSDYSENCYESVYLDHCYNCRYAYESSNCLDCAFIFDCRGCGSCFGCYNLRNKKYCFFNKQLTKEEYNKKIKDINLGRRTVVREWQSKFLEAIRHAIWRGTNNIRSEGSVGNILRGCRNCFWTFRQLGNSENIRYVASTTESKDCMDCFGLGTSSSATESVYESTGIVGGNDVKFSILCRESWGIEYSGELTDCEHCFACFGLRNKKYCVFNKQYEQAEYWRMVDELKTSMLARGEYGEFFPLSMSWFPYHDTNAQIEFPLSKQEIMKRGWHWEDKEQSTVDLSKLAVVLADQVPDDSSDVGSDFLEKAIVCEKTQRPFRITKFEFDFYKVKKIPLPTVHPEERIRTRLLEWKLPYAMFRYPCSRCGKISWMGRRPQEGRRTYCEQCYQQEVA